MFLFNRRPLAPHAARLKTAKRIHRAMHAQCRALKCQIEADRHSHVCEKIAYQMAAGEAIADTLSDDQAERFGAHG